jgi:hypothetical protein
MKLIRVKRKFDEEKGMDIYEGESIEGGEDHDDGSIDLPGLPGGGLGGDWAQHPKPGAGTEVAD